MRSNLQRVVLQHLSLTLCGPPYRFGPPPLQCIELALDTRCLRIPGHFTADSDRLQGGFLELPMHPNFRLFAAQNPSTAQYSGRRFSHSAALLSRFSMTVWQPLPPDELRQILEHHLGSIFTPGPQRALAGAVMAVYRRMEQSPLQEPFPLTVRDLLRYT